jgi:hypothetical protein
VQYRVSQGLTQQSVAGHCGDRLADRKKRTMKLGFVSVRHATITF